MGKQNKQAKRLKMKKWLQRTAPHDSFSAEFKMLDLKRHPERQPEVWRREHPDYWRTFIDER